MLMSDIRVSIRARLPFAIAALVVIAFGLFSRSPAAPPGLFATYGGDVLWATLVYLLFRSLYPPLAIWRAALYAALFALAIEVSQLYHAPWIDAIRQTWLGGLVLGFSFLWSDLACYSVGILLGVVGESLFCLALRRATL